jgi:hypothetical protein
MPEDRGKVQNEMLKYVENSLWELKVKRWRLKVNNREQASVVKKAKDFGRWVGGSFAS